MLFLKFCLAGLVNTSLNISTMLFFLSFDAYVLIASAAGFIVGATSGYIFNFYFTFKSKNDFYNKLLFYFPLQLVCLIVTMLIVYTAINLFFYNPIISQVFAIIITTFINFFISRKYIFNKK